MKLRERVSRVVWVIYLILMFPVAALSTALACFFLCIALQIGSVPSTTAVSIGSIGITFLIPITWILNLCFAEKVNGTRFVYAPFIINALIMASILCLYSIAPSDFMIQGDDPVIYYLATLTGLLSLGGICALKTSYEKERS